MLNLILERYDSYAILATHSPIIIQEIPSKNILVFERIGNMSNIKKLSIESFGENLSVITKHVFKTINTEENYKVVLKNLSNEKSFENVSAMFDDRLSLNAEIYLQSCYPNEKS